MNKTRRSSRKGVSDRIHLLYDSSMALKAEQIGRKGPYRGGSRKTVKQQTHRLRRRLERADPEKAPRRLAYHGYYD
jgi:hypothetical protein